MAIDGLAVRTRQPYSTESVNFKSYRCRKGGFAVIVMAGCDVRGNFLMAAPNHAGSTNDILAWNSSELHSALERGELDERYFIIGDEAFSCTNYLLSPWPGRGIGKYKDSFNYWLSHSRQCIERAFGMLVRRWGIFSRKLECAFDRWPLVILTCMKLHNICIDHSVSVPTRRLAEDYMSGDETVVNTNENLETDHLLRQRAVGNRRANITYELEMKGKGRPPHAECNNRV